MQQIDVFTWLAEVVNCLSDTPPQVETMERREFKKLTIFFEIPAK
jgi:hypothetical protein